MGRKSVSTFPSPLLYTSTYYIYCILSLARCPHKLHSTCYVKLFRVLLLTANEISLSNSDMMEQDTPLPTKKTNKQLNKQPNIQTCGEVIQILFLATNVSQHFLDFTGRVVQRKLLEVNETGYCN